MLIVGLTILSALALIFKVFTQLQISLKVFIIKLCKLSVNRQKLFDITNALVQNKLELIKHELLARVINSNILKITSCSLYLTLKYKLYIIYLQKKCRKICVISLEKQYSVNNSAVQDVFQSQLSLIVQFLVYNNIFN